VKALVFLVAALAAFPVCAQVTIENAWARATPPGAKTAAGYMVLRNGASPDRLIGAASPAAERVELHTTVRDGDIARMREVKSYAIPANGRFELKPGSSHLMLVNPKAPLTAGQKVPVVLKFEKAGEVSTQLEVRPLGAAQDPHKGHH
jgi:periplasmic copper chaperone A